MQGVQNMQLFIILALLLLGGRADAQNILSEVKPVLETMGGEEIKEAIKSAEEISSVLSAVQTMGKAASPQPAENVSFPLAPVSSIADKDITYSLSQYIAQT